MKLLLPYSSLDMKKFNARANTQGDSGKVGTTMGQMTAMTAIELEAARRRETVLDDRAAVVASERERVQRDRPARRELAWLATLMATGARVARG